MQELQNKNSKLQYFTVREDDFIASLSRFPSFVLAEAANNPDTQGVACQYKRYKLAHHNNVIPFSAVGRS